MEINTPLLQSEQVLDLLETDPACLAKSYLMSRGRHL